MIHWREEGEEIKPGLNLWRLSCDHSFGFLLELDTLRVRLRYSKRLKEWFWWYERLEPRAWRILKGKE